MSETDFWKHHRSRAALATALHSHIVQWTRYFQSRKLKSAPEWNTGRPGAFGIMEWGSNPQKVPPVGPYQKAMEKHVYNSPSVSSKDKPSGNEGASGPDQLRGVQSSAPHHSDFPALSSSRPSTSALTLFREDSHRNKDDDSKYILYCSRAGKDFLTVPEMANSSKHTERAGSLAEAPSSDSARWEELHQNEDDDLALLGATPKAVEGELRKRRASINLVPEAFSQISESSDDEEQPQAEVRVRMNESPTLDLFADDSSDSAIDYEDYEPGQLIPETEAKDEDAPHYRKRRSMSMQHDEQLREFQEQQRKIHKRKELKRRRASLDRIEYASSNLSSVEGVQENEEDEEAQSMIMGDTSDENLRKQCARALRELSKEPSNRFRILREGAFEALVRVLQDTDDSRTTYDCIASFFYLSSIQRSVRADMNIGIQPVAAFNGSPQNSRTPYVPRPLVGTMNNLEILNQILVWVVRNNTDTTLEYLENMQSSQLEDDPNADTDQQYPIDPGHFQLDSRVIGALCEQSASAKGSVRTLLISCLFNLSTYNSNSLSSKDMLQALFSLLHPVTAERPDDVYALRNDAVSLTLIVRTLSNICLSEKGRADFLANTGVLKLSRYWFWFSPRLQLTIASRIIEPLARERENLSAIAEEGGVWMLRDTISSIYLRWKHRITYDQRTGEPLNSFPSAEDGVDRNRTNELKGSLLMPVEYQLVLDSWVLRRCIRALARLCHVRIGIIKTIRGYGAAALAEGIHLLVASPLGYELEKFLLSRISEIYGDLDTVQEYMDEHDFETEVSYSSHSRALVQGYPLVADLLNNLRTPRIIRKFVVGANRLLRHADFPLAAIQGIGSALAVSLDMLRRSACTKSEEGEPRLKMEYLDTRSVSLILQAFCILFSDKRAAVATEKCGGLASMARLAIMLEQALLEPIPIPHQDHNKNSMMIYDLHRFSALCMMAIYNASCHEMVGRRMLLGIQEVHRPFGSRNSMGAKEELRKWQAENAVGLDYVSNVVKSLYHVTLMCLSCINSKGPPEEEIDDVTSSQQSLGSMGKRRQGDGSIIYRAIQFNAKGKYEHCQDIFLVNGYVAPLPCPTVYRCLSFAIGALRNLSEVSLPGVHYEDGSACSRLLRTGIMKAINPLFHPLNSSHTMGTPNDASDGEDFVPLPLMTEGLKLVYNLSSDAKYGHVVVTSGALHYLVPIALDDEKSPAKEAHTSYLRQLKFMKSEFPEFEGEIDREAKQTSTAQAYELRRVATSFRVPATHAYEQKTDTIAQRVEAQGVRMILFADVSTGSVDKLLRRSVKDCQQFCALTLANLATEVARNRDYHCEGVLRSLVLLSKYDGSNTVARVKIASAFRTLAASSADICARMVEEKVVPTLVELVSSNDDSVRRHAAVALYYLSRVDRKLETVLLQDDTIPALLTTALIRSLDPMVQALCIEAVYNILANPDTRQDGLTATVIWVLQRLCTSPDNDVQRACAITLLRLSSEPNTRELLVKHGGIKSVVLVLLGRSEEEKEWESLSKSHWYEKGTQDEEKSGLAINTSMTDVFGEIPEEIKQAMSHYASLSSLRGASNYGNDSLDQKSFYDFVSLAKFRTRPPVGVRDPAVGTLFAEVIANVAKGVGNEIKLAMAGAVEALSMLIDMGDRSDLVGQGRWPSVSSNQMSRLRPNCALGLYNLSRCIEEAVHERIIGQGGVEVFVRLGTNPDEHRFTRRLCCLGLSHLIWGSSSRTLLSDLRTRGAPKVFISIIGRKSLNVNSEESPTSELSDVYAAAVNLHRLSLPQSFDGQEAKEVWRQLNEFGTVSACMQLLSIHRNLVENAYPVGSPDARSDSWILPTALAAIGSSLLANSTISRKSFKVLSGNQGLGFKEICLAANSISILLDDDQFWSAKNAGRETLLELAQLAADDLVYVLTLASTHVGLTRILFDTGVVNVCARLLSCKRLLLKTKVRAASVLRNLSSHEGTEDIFVNLVEGSSVLENVVRTCRSMEDFKNFDHTLKQGTSSEDVQYDVSVGAFIRKTPIIQQEADNLWENNSSNRYMPLTSNFSVPHGQHSQGLELRPVISYDQLEALCTSEKRYSASDSSSSSEGASWREVLREKAFLLIVNCAGALINFSAMKPLRKTLIRNGAAGALIAVSRHELTSKALQSAALKALCEVAIGVDESRTGDVTEDAEVTNSLKERVVKEGAVAALIAVMRDNRKEGDTEYLEKHSQNPDEDRIIHQLLEQRDLAASASVSISDEMSQLNAEVGAISTRSTVTSAAIFYEMVPWEWIMSKDDSMAQVLRGSVELLMNPTFLYSTDSDSYLMNVKHCVSHMDLRQKHFPPVSVQAAFGTTTDKLVMETRDSKGSHRRQEQEKNTSRVWSKIHHKVDVSMLPRVTKHAISKRPNGKTVDPDSAGSSFGICSGDISDCVKPAPSRTYQHHQADTDEGFAEDKDASRLGEGITSASSVDSEDGIEMHQDFECDLIDSDSDDEEGQMAAVANAGISKHRRRRSSIARVFYFCQESVDFAFPFVVSEECVNAGLNSQNVYCPLDNDSAERMMFVGTDLAPGNDKNVEDMTSFENKLSEASVQTETAIARESLRRYVEWCHGISDDDKKRPRVAQRNTYIAGTTLDILGIDPNSTRTAPSEVVSALETFARISVPTSKDEYPDSIQTLIRGWKTTSDASLDGSSIALACETILVTSHSHFLQRGLQLALCEVPQGVATDSLCSRVLREMYQDDFIEELGEPSQTIEEPETQEESSEHAEHPIETGSTATTADTKKITFEEKSEEPAKNNVFDRLYNHWLNRQQTADAAPRSTEGSSRPEAKPEEKEGHEEFKGVTLYDKWFGKHRYLVNPRQTEAKTHEPLEEKRSAKSPNTQQRKLLQAYRPTKTAVSRPSTTDRHRRRLFSQPHSAMSGENS